MSLKFALDSTSTEPVCISEGLFLPGNIHFNKFLKCKKFEHGIRLFIDFAF